MQHNLMSGLHINAYEFGALAAFYYYAYTPMQIPVGMIYDRFGVRMVQFIACAIAVFGVCIFIVQKCLWQLNVQVQKFWH